MSTVYKRRSRALDLDSFQQLQGAGLFRVQLRVELEFGLSRALLALGPADVARDVRQILQQRPEAVQRRPVRGPARGWGMSPSRRQTDTLKSIWP